MKKESKNLLFNYWVLCFVIPFILFSTGVSGQNDEVIYKEKKNGFYQDSILSAIGEFENSSNPAEVKTYLSLDFSDDNYPTEIDEYTQYWHNPPVSQGSTGTCWCYAATSMFESEVYRTTGKEIKLSEMYFVYYEYIERAKAFVQLRGDIYFGEGSEANAVPKLMKLYGAVPLSAYKGKLKGQKFHNHKKMVKELKTYLASVKSSGDWNEEGVVSTFKSILNHYMGEPPVSFKYEGKEYTPMDFVSTFLKFNPNDYFSFMSTKSLVYNQKGELVEPDNWWRNDDYYNVDLSDFIIIFKNAIKNGYSVSFCGDVSEPGYDRYTEVGIIPSFDIPAEYIDADSREYRINNNSTTDDHCMHIVGYLENKDGWWFLIKDSSSSGFDGPTKGYHYLHEDYFKLKILTILVHKYGAMDVLDKIIK